MQADRRIFVIRSTVGVATLAAAPLVVAMAGPVTDEKDPKAVALGYRDDATKIDAAKYPQYVAGQTCVSCVNFQGKPGIAAGPCTHMPKPVLAFGWCSAYAKKS
jgi:High potential iron-sulfur protein